MSQSLLRFFEDDPEEACIPTVSSYEINEFNELSPSKPIDNSFLSLISYTDTPENETFCKSAESPDQPHAQGREMLTPFFPVIQAAHRNELPAVPLAWSPAGELNGYVCAIAAGIWYGHTLDDPPRLAAHLENLKRLQADYERKEAKP